jgi:hypothetical protein
MKGIINKEQITVLNSNPNRNGKSNNRINRGFPSEIQPEEIPEKVRM